MYIYIYIYVYIVIYVIMYVAKKELAEFPSLIATPHA